MPVVCPVDITVVVLVGGVDVLWLDCGELRSVRCEPFQRAYIRRNVPHCVRNAGTGEAVVLRCPASGEAELSCQPRREWAAAFAAAAVRPPIR